MRTARKAAKKRVRSLVDRIALPYVDAVTSRLDNERNARSSSAGDASGHVGPARESTSDIAATNGTSDRFHLANHELRTLELERVPKGARRVLSVGANGRWYFDWFEKAVGIVDEHLGVEAFEPKPDDLPSYVTWIPDTADRMVGVDDSSVDLVFAGQTSEHLWSYELSGFLEEARRVLRSGGLLVLDSPNRLVTEHLLWSHGGHTVELSVAEITELATLAGFEVISTAGIWRCEIDGRRLQLEEGLDDSAIFTRRAASAREAPDHSFVWWINARRTDAAPDTSRLRARTKELFESHWNTRVCRGLFPAPGADRMFIQRGDVGTVGTTLPFPLKPGAFELTATLLSGNWDDLDGFQLDIVAPVDQVVHRLTVDCADRSGTELRWTFDQPHLLFATIIDVHVDHVRSPVTLKLPLELSCDV